MNSGAWLVAIGMAIATAGWVLHRERAAMPSSALRLPAQVVQVEQRTIASADTTETLFAPRIRFRHPDGREGVFVADVWTHAPQHRSGESVHVLVDEATGRIILDSASSAWGPLALFAGTGFLLVAIGVVRLFTRA
ncbi:MAG: DUF3592 domain-containing protein [Rhodocyclaceae bacterium]|nr:DUF3592 domain-containing protein [Rhodocyclaceae bacterium]MCA3076016.1 DUF3592 domain-containing protein [Rhodocyclaceae bacterium]MCA3090212.1 DUF3592 domain-containing protein [Rhodocyclaceae bacterium]MCA3093784.1 DUF3592 domain-containing protein [Rhodocyclaceae bacterium]MCA3098851.1 DUF3592 domain-containing protein [Rhodocyclaceae bacterium]